MVIASETLQGLHCPADVAVERLRERYAALYTQASQHTLEALDNFEQLKDAVELKTKILYSVVVVSINCFTVFELAERERELKI